MFNDSKLLFQYKYAIDSFLSKIEHKWYRNEEGFNNLQKQCYALLEQSEKIYSVYNLENGNRLDSLINFQTSFLKILTYYMDNINPENKDYDAYFNYFANILDLYRAYNAQINYLNYSKVLSAENQEDVLLFNDNNPVKINQSYVADFASNNQRISELIEPLLTQRTNLFPNIPTNDSLVDNTTKISNLLNIEPLKLSNVAEEQPEIETIDNNPVEEDTLNPLDLINETPELEENLETNMDELSDRISIGQQFTTQDGCNIYNDWQSAANQNDGIVNTNNLNKAVGGIHINDGSPDGLYYSNNDALTYLSPDAQIDAILAVDPITNNAIGWFNYNDVKNNLQASKL